jgi:hypothetical protein
VLCAIYKLSQLLIAHLCNDPAIDDKATAGSLLNLESLALDSDHFLSALEHADKPANLQRSLNFVSSYHPEGNARLPETNYRRHYVALQFILKGHDSKQFHARTRLIPHLLQQAAIV